MAASGSVRRDQRRSRDRRRQRSSLRVWNRAVAAPVHHLRRCTHALELSPDVEAIDKLQQRRGGLGARRRPLQAREALPLLRVRIAEEDAGEHARAQAPMRAHRRDDRVPDRGRRDRGAIRVGAVQQQPIDAFREPRGKRDRRAAARRSAEQRDALQSELVQDRTEQCNLALQRPLPGLHVAVGHADARPVVPHQRVSFADGGPERSERRIAPVEVEMADPPRRRDQRRSLSAHRKGDASAPEPQEPDLHLARHERDATTAAPPYECQPGLMSVVPGM